MFTTSGTIAPFPSYSVDVPVPLLPIQNGVAPNPLPPGILQMGILMVGNSWKIRNQVVNQIIVGRSALGRKQSRESTEQNQMFFQS